MRELSSGELAILDGMRDEQRVLALAGSDEERAFWQEAFEARAEYVAAHEEHVREALSRIAIDVGAEHFFDATDALMRQRKCVPV